MNIRLASKTLTVALAILLIWIAYRYADHRIVKEESWGAFNYIVYDNPEDLYRDAELVLVAEATSTSREVVSKGEYLDGYTLTEVIPMEVLKNERNQSIQDRVTIIEPAFSVDNGITSIGKTQYYFEEYRKVIPNAKYLLFLNWDKNKNAYWVHALHQGKMNIDGRDNEELGVSEQDPTFKKLKEATLQSYLTSSSAR